jgi:hypothetical protein
MCYVEWKAFNHPQFGDIEIEGLKELYWNHPGFMIQEDAHRNMASFTIYQTQNQKL